ncbi:MAG: DUF5686 family protein [Nonlabens sp.]
MSYRLFFFILLASTTVLIAQRPVSELVKEAIALKKSNDPRERFEEYSYTAYQNLKVLGDPEALTGPGYKKTELRKTLKKTGVFLAEKYSTFIHSKEEGFKEKIVAAHMPGFDKPVYPIYTIEFLSENLYDDDYVIFDRSFRNPLSSESVHLYRFKQEVDTLVNDRPVIKINFEPAIDQSNDLLSGSLYLDKQTLAIAHAVYRSQGDLNIDAIHGFAYDSVLESWVGSNRSLFVRKEKTAKEFELFGARLQVGNENPDRVGKNDNLYLVLTSTRTNHSINPVADYGQGGLAIEIKEEALELPDDFWDQFNDDAQPTNRELALQVGLDSIVDDSRITRKLEVLDKFKVGYYPVGFFDIDLKYLIKFNDFEAFRLGVGGTTNEKFSENWRVGGYVAYGTRDARFKYKINLGYRINKLNDSWLNIYRRDDITEFAAESFLTDARVYSLFEPRLINIPTFYRFEEYGSTLQQRLLPSLISEVSLSRKRVLQTTDYQFQPEMGGELFQNYILSEATIAMRYSPRSKFMRTPSGYQEIKAGYPIISGQLTKGFENVVDSDFGYLKLSGKAFYALENRNGTQTEFTVEGHYGSGEIPLTHLYHAYPNSPNDPEVFGRFSVAGRRSFETMYFNEFFSDKLLIGQVKHRLKPFNIASFLKPEMVLITRFAWGNLDDEQQHINVAFDTLEKGYFESGFELNKLIYGFGLSMNYRYGPYHLSDVEDNLAVKFTFYLEL